MQAIFWIVQDQGPYTSIILRLAFQVAQFTYKGNGINVYVAFQAVEFLQLCRNLLCLKDKYEADWLT